MRAYIHRKKRYVAILWKLGDWHFKRINLKGLVHGHNNNVSVFNEPNFSLACTKARKENKDIPASGWDRKTFLSKGTCRTENEVYPQVWKS